MSRANQHRARGSDGNAHRRVAAGTPRRPGTGRTRRARWLPVAVLVAVVVAGLVGWRVIAAIGGENGGAAARPIATIAAPDIHSLLIDPANPDRILFGSHAGVQESQGGGFTWRPGTLSNADAMSMAASPEEAATRYVAGHDVFLVSRDGGETWEPVPHDLPGTDLHAFAQDPTDPQRLYALVVGAGVFTSADGGSQWTALPTQPPGVAGHGALATDGTALYAVTSAGLVRSADGGNTWEPTQAQPSGMVISLALPSAASGTLYAGTESGVAKSTDGGASWVTLGPTDAAVLAVAVAPTAPDQLVVVDETGAVFRSDDGGGAWLAPR